MPNHYPMSIGRSAAIAKPASAAKKRAKKITGLLGESKALRGKMKTAVNAEVEALKKGEAELKAVAKKSPKKAAPKKSPKKASAKKAAPKKSSAKKSAPKKAAPKKASAKKAAPKKAAPKKSTDKASGATSSFRKGAHSFAGWVDQLVQGATAPDMTGTIAGLTHAMRRIVSENERGAVSNAELSRLREVTKFLHQYASDPSKAGRPPVAVQASSHWHAMSRSHRS